MKSIFLTFIPAALAALIGLTIVVWFAKVVFEALFGDIRSLRGRWGIQRKEFLLRQIDEFLKQKAPQKAFLLLRDSFYLDFPRLDDDLVERINQYHLGVLSRILNISESYSLRLSNLPVIEELLQSRIQLFRAYLVALDSKQGLKKKKSEASRDIPEWAFAEYGKKIEEFRDKIATNRKSLESQLKDLFSRLERVAVADEVTYH